MKILQVAPPWIDTPPKAYGGTELIIHALAEEHIKMGHEVTLFATKNSSTSAKLEYIFDDCLLDKNIPWTSALSSVVHYHQGFSKAKDFDIVHAHLSSDTDTIILPFLADITVPKIVTVHGNWPFDKHTDTDKYYLKYYADKMPFVHISKTMVDIQPKVLNSIGFVHNGVNVQSFDFNPEKGSYLTWLGKIKYDKGIAEAIQVALECGEKLVFAGVVDEHVKESVDYYNEKVKPFIDDDQIKFLGPANAKLKNELLRNAKAFLNPIHWEEPFGMVMAESMATGTPVISFGRGAANELILNGKTGFLIEENNLDAMIEAIKKIDTIDRKACREHVEKNLSSTAMAKGYLEMYERVIGSKI